MLIILEFLALFWIGKLWCQYPFWYPNLKYFSLKIRFGIYVYSDQNNIVFLYSDGKKEAVKYNIKTDSHRKIKSSKSIVTRVGYPIGLRIGNLFWIIGGIYLAHWIQQPILKLWIVIFMNLLTNLLFLLPKTIWLVKKVKIKHMFIVFELVLGSGE